MSDAVKKNAVKTTQMDGDLSVGRNIAVGGDITTQGNSHFKGNVRIDGWFDARNIKDQNKGLFLTPDALKAAYPFPQKGWYALVGATLPADVYVVNNDTWIASGMKGGAPSLDLDFVYNKQEIDNKLEGQKQEINTLIEKTDGFAETLDTFKEESEVLKTEIDMALGGATARFDGIVSGVDVQSVAAIPIEGVFFDDVHKLFVAKYAGGYTNNWDTADLFMNFDRTKPLEDKVYISDSKVWCWDNATNDLVVVNESNLQSMQANIDALMAGAKNQENINKELSEKVNLRSPDVVLSEQEYEALDEKKADTLYLVYEDE